MSERLQAGTKVVITTKYRIGQRDELEYISNVDKVFQGKVLEVGLKTYKVQLRDGTILPRIREQSIRAVPSHRRLVNSTKAYFGVKARIMSGDIVRATPNYFDVSCEGQVIKIAKHLCIKHNHNL